MTSHTPRSTHSGTIGDTQMFQKFILSQAINIASLAVAELVKKYKESFNLEESRAKIHENIRVLIKPSFLGEKAFEDRAIAVADWFLDRIDNAMDDGPEFVNPILQALANKNVQAAVELIKNFAKGVLKIEGGAPGVQSGNTDEILVAAYLEENPDAVQESEEPFNQKSSESEGGKQPEVKDHPAHTQQFISNTDSMTPPEQRLEMQQGNQPKIKGNESQNSLEGEGEGPQ